MNDFMKSLRVCMKKTIFLVSMGCSGVAQAAPGIVDLGVLPGYASSSGVSVSDDGSIVAGTSFSSNAWRVFRWTAEGGMEDIGVLSEYVDSSGGVMSADGSVIAGVCFPAESSSPRRAFRWTRDEGIQDIGLSPIQQTIYCTGISADGSVVIGYYEFGTRYIAARWDATSGWDGLDGLFPEYASTVTAGANADGSIIVGSIFVSSIDVRAFRWTRKNGGEDLGRLVPSYHYVLAGAISDDSSAVTGYGNVDGDRHAYRWTRERGLEDLGLLNNEIDTRGLAVSDNGWAIVGTTANSNDRAILWTRYLGIVDLNSYLPTIGIDLQEWTLYQASDISSDGTSMVGYGSHNGQWRAWLITGLPRPCKVDFNNSGVVSVEDIFAFLTAWLENDSSADFNGLNGTTVQDIFDFLTAWLAGC